MPDLQVGRGIDYGKWRGSALSATRRMRKHVVTAGAGIHANIQLDVNAARAASARLKISSRVLHLVRVVRDCDVPNP